MNNVATFFPSFIKPSKAITVVAHGLNNKPSVMMALAKFLQTIGSDVVMVSLTGHGNDLNDVSCISREKWLDDLYQSYLVAQSTFGKGELKPIFFLGYSLGALVNLDLMAQYSQVVNYDKMVLLAPANALRKRVQVLGWLSKPFHNSAYKLPSLMPQAYRANPFTPIQAYKALFEMCASIEKANYRNLNIPTLVVVDPKDEMISWKALQQIKMKYGLDKWHLFHFNKGLRSENKYYHLIVDEPSVGSESWAAITYQIQAFLNLP